MKTGIQRFFMLAILLLSFHNTNADSSSGKKKKSSKDSCCATPIFCMTTSGTTNLTLTRVPSSPPSPGDMVIGTVADNPSDPDFLSAQLVCTFVSLTPEFGLQCHVTVQTTNGILTATGYAKQSAERFAITGGTDLLLGATGAILIDGGVQEGPTVFTTELCTPVYSS